MGALPRAAQRRVRGDAGAGDAHGRLHVGPRVLHGALASGGTPAWAAAVRRTTVGVRGHGATHDACCRGHAGLGGRHGREVNYRHSATVDRCKPMEPLNLGPPRRSVRPLRRRSSTGIRPERPPWVPATGPPAEPPGAPNPAGFRLRSCRGNCATIWAGSPTGRVGWISQDCLPLDLGARRAHACAACGHSGGAGGHGLGQQTPDGDRNRIEGGTLVPVIENEVRRSCCLDSEPHRKAQTRGLGLRAIQPCRTPPTSAWPRRTWIRPPAATIPA